MNYPLRSSKKKPKKCSKKLRDSKDYSRRFLENNAVQTEKRLLEILNILSLNDYSRYYLFFCLQNNQAMILVEIHTFTKLYCFFIFQERNRGRERGIQL